MAAPPKASRALVTLLFTDIVGSTKIASEIGDAEWRRVLDRHDAIIRAALKKHGGREVKVNGDGFLIAFNTPGPALHCAEQIVARAPELGVSIRAGVHTGECDVRKKDLSGIVVNTASRIAGAAKPNEILLSKTVKELLTGAGFTFTQKGSRALRGVQKRVTLFSLGAPSTDQKPTAKGSRSRKTTASKLNVLLVDDHPLWRETVKTLFVRLGGLKVVEVGSGEEAIKVAATMKPDVTVMDIDLPGMSGIDATSRVLQASPTTRVLMLSSSDDRAKVLRAVRAGASGYMVKTAQAEELIDAILRIHEGQVAFPPALADVVLEALRGREPEPPMRIAVFSYWVVGRQGLVKIAQEAGLDVIDAGGTEEPIIDIVSRFDPTCLLVELGSGSVAEKMLEEIHELRAFKPGYPVLVLCDELESQTALDVASGDAHAIGYLSKKHVAESEDLVGVLKRIVQGEAVIDPDLVSRLVQHKNARKAIGKLSEREQEVLALMAEGRSNQAICDRLFVSPKTIETRVAAIFTKLGLPPAPDDHRRVLAVLAHLKAKESL
ncbi:MAG: hypothetical protein NVSMB57_11060 [Actinomycetota bacterium]